MPTTFDDLPAEMRLKSLSYLGAREIQQCRRVCRSWRHLVDLIGNQRLVSGRGVAASRTRIKAVVERYCEYPIVAKDENGNATALLNAFRDFSMLYGLGNAALDFDYDEHLARFVFHFLTRDMAISGMGAGPTGVDVHQWTMLLVCLANLHIYGHHHAHPPVNTEVYIAWVKHALAQVPQQAQFLITAVKQGFLNGLVYRPDWNGMPLDSRTPILDPLSWNSYDSNAHVAQLLAVPHIPNTASYQYYFQTEWARGRAQEGINGGDLSSLAKAALLEDLMLG